MAKRIASVGFEIPGHPREVFTIDSGRSLLDFDIVIFCPDTSVYARPAFDSYQGKPCLSEHRSEEFFSHTKHWKQEITAAFNCGKTVVIFMPSIEDFFVDTGEKKYSGTGKSQSVTKIVRPDSTLAFLPFEFTQVSNAVGDRVRLTDAAHFLKLYWDDFASLSNYRCHFSSNVILPLIQTEAGERVVGGLIKGKAKSGGPAGKILLLPQISWGRECYSADFNGWSGHGNQLGHLLIRRLVDIHDSLVRDDQSTPAPDWLRQPCFVLKAEAELMGQMSSIDSQIAELTKQKEELTSKLSDERELKWLLYEKGERLESAILQALNVLGLEAARYKESDSEFDAVFSWNGQRFIGEAEGKDSKSINIDKMSQLERNIGEEFHREDVSDHAKGVLFGNAFRLQPIEERGDFFTEKVIIAAKRLGSALIRTPDLFVVARYVKESGDRAFAQKCLEQIFSTSGAVVDFPPIPACAAA